MGEVISLLSGAGGVGRSACAAGIGLALAGAGKKVLCIDCCAGTGALDLYLGMERQDALSYADICRGDYPLSRAAVHPSLPALRFLSAPIRPEAVIADPFRRVLSMAKREFDFILLDAPAGFGDMADCAAAVADRCVVLCGIDPASIRAAGRMADELQLLGKTDVRLLVNRVHPGRLKAMKLNIDDIMDRTGLPLLGLVPEEEAVLFAVASDTFPAGKRGAFAAYGRIAKRIQGQPVPVPTR